MILKSRLTKEFIEIKVCELNTTIFKSDREQIENAIDNLLSVVYDLSRQTEYDLDHYVNKFLNE